MAEIEDQGNQFERILTERLLLRRPVNTDLDAIFEMHSDPAANTFNPAGPDPDRAASKQRLQEWLDHWHQHGFGYWTVQPVEGEAIFGFCGVRYGSWLERPVLNLYYRFDPATWGRGFATEAARRAVRFATDHFPAVPVMARTTTGNISSQRTAVAAGLNRRADLDRPEGTGHAVILVTDWPTAPQISAPTSP